MQRLFMHIHILGICGTFMGSLAQLAVAQGLRVTGCDANVYPPMSTQLESAGIEIIDGFGIDQLSDSIDLFVIGNSMSRGNPLVEEILNRGLPFTSGPQFLADHILPGKWVLGVGPSYTWRPSRRALLTHARWWHSATKTKAGCAYGRKKHASAGSRCRSTQTRNSIG